MANASIVSRLPEMAPVLLSGGEAGADVGGEGKRMTEKAKRASESDICKQWLKN